MRLRVNCLECGKSFSTWLSDRRRGNGRFCCIQHGVDYNKRLTNKSFISNEHKTPNVTCAFCGLKFFKHNIKKTSKSLFCSLVCQKKHSKAFAHKKSIDRWLAKDSNGSYINNVKTITTTMRQWIFGTRGKKCEVCGWCEINPVTGRTFVEIHHIDGNPKNNIPENLQVLCLNHHSLTPTFRVCNHKKKQ